MHLGDVAPPPEALQEAQDVVSVSPLNEDDLPDSSLSARCRLRLPQRQRQRQPR